MSESTKKVIIVDDEAEFRRWLRTLLARSAVLKCVGDAANGEDAISLAEIMDPDIIVADVYLPDMDGFELTERLREINPACKFVLMSAHGEKVYSRMASDRGELKFIPKTQFSLEKLETAVE
jgi:two-component system, response regulator YesN